jgi:hypothetical protein
MASTRSFHRLPSMSGMFHIGQAWAGRVSPRHRPGERPPSNVGRCGDPRPPVAPLPPACIRSSRVPRHASDVVPIPRHFRSVSRGASGRKYRTLFIQVSVKLGSRKPSSRKPTAAIPETIDLARTHLQRACLVTPRPDMSADIPIWTETGMTGGFNHEVQRG